MSFEVGGSWLEARRLPDNATDAPRFTEPMPTPFAVEAGASHTVSVGFSAPASTEAGVYLVALTVALQYVNATGERVDARFASLGSLDEANRSHVDLSNFTATLDALGLDGVVPDTSVTVDDGGALRLWTLAAAFGAAVVAAGAGYGFVLRRRGGQGRHKSP
jgi:hypothetical protein